MEGELVDWELVHGSDTESVDSIASNKKSSSASAIDDGMILSDHFSTDNNLINVPDDQSHDGVMESGDSSRVDYGSEDPNPVDLGFDQLNVYQSGDSCVINELGFNGSKTTISGDSEVRLSDFLTGGTVPQYDDASKCFSELNDLEGRHVENRSAVEEPIEDSSKSLSDSGGHELVSGDSGIVNGEEEIVSDCGVVSTEAIEVSGGSIVEVGDVNSAVRSGDESKSRETVWWKMPFMLLKDCAFRIGPVSSFSMAAAVVGLVLLGGRLYNLKKKAQRFNLKVTIDDKKVARVMSQAARLNEVFTEVRRVPVIRPALPSPGTWPVLSLR